MEKSAIFRYIELILANPESVLSENLDKFHALNQQTPDEDVLGRGYETFFIDERTRKENGIYYTPSVFTSFLAEKVVNYLFDPLIQKVKNAIVEKDRDALRGLAYEWISIKILDPSCGSGSFLIKVLRKVYEKYQELKHVLKDHELFRIVFLDDAYTYMSALCERHIYGVDVDERALKIAKVNLLKELVRLRPELYSVDKKWVFPTLENNLIKANALELPEVQKYCAIIGNPPYGNLLSDVKKKLYGQVYFYSELSEISSLFVEKSTKLLKDSGILAFVITAAFAYHVGMQKLRRYLKTAFEKIEVYSFDRDRAVPFEDMSQSVSLVVGYDKGRKKQGQFWTSEFYREMPSTDDLRLYPASEFENVLPRLPKVGKELTARVLRKLLSKKTFLASILSEKPLENYEKLYYRTSGNYWYNAWDKKPYESSNVKQIYVAKPFAEFFLLLINSSLFYLWMRVFGDGRQLSADIMNRFPLVEKDLLNHDKLSYLKDKLMSSLYRVFNAQRERFETSKIKEVIDHVDLYLCGLYGLDEEETLHVLDYDRQARGGIKSMPF